MAEDTRSQGTCLKTCVEKVHLDFWLKLLETGITDQDLMNRLVNWWSTTASVSGIIAGFTYIAASSGDIKYTNVDGVLSDYRIQLFGIMSMFSFTLSLFATILGASLFGIINYLGVESVRWFIESSWWMINIPISSCSGGIILMLCSALVSVGGIVDTWAYYVIATFGACVFLIFFVISWRMARLIYARVCLLGEQHRMHIIQTGGKGHDDLNVAGVTNKSSIET